MTRIPLYRTFRLRLVAATIAIFAMGVATTLILESGRNLWLSATWAAVCSPVLVAIAICILAPVERTAVSLGLSTGGGLPKIRPAVVLWFICAIALPWVAAWLIANVAGNWYQDWHQPAMADPGSFFLWAVRVASGIVAYSIASALGLVLVYLLDQEPDRAPRQGD